MKRITSWWMKQQAVFHSLALNPFDLFHKFHAFRSTRGSGRPALCTVRISTVLLLILLVALAVFPPTPIAATRWVTVQLTDNEVDDDKTSELLSDSCAVWTEIPVGNVFRLRMIDGTVPTKEDVEMISEGGGAYATSVNDACHVTWSVNYIEDSEIFFHDGTDAIRLTDDDLDQNGPMINNLDQIVWSTDDPEEDWKRKIHLYDAGDVSQLTHNDHDNWRAKITDNGHVAWLFREGESSDFEIVLYEGTPDPLPLTTNDLFDADFDINSAGHLVWTQRPQDAAYPNDVMFYDGTDIINLTEDSYNDSSPEINNNDQIVWHNQEPAGYYSIRFYDDGELTQLTDDTYHATNPDISPNNTYIVWEGGWLEDPESWEIYLYYNGDTTQLTVNSVEDARPIVNDQGYVLWEQFDGNDWEIMLAVPVEVPEYQWALTYGGDQWDAAADVIETTDQGYLVAGSTRSFGAAEADVWVIKLDPEGAVQWERRYGGPANDIAACVREVSGGYILGGTTASFGSGSLDAWLVKLDETGNVLWEKAYGGAEKEELACVEVIDEGAGDYVFAASSWSFESGGYPEFPYSHIWLVKVDKDTGNILWQKVYAQSPYDRAGSIEQTADGGFVIGGDTNAPGLGNHDFWVLKLDSSGAIEWQKAYGQNEWVPADPWFHYLEWDAYVRQAPDGGYLLAGTSQSNNTKVQFAWVLKLDADGAIEWEHWGGIPYVTDVLPPSAISNEYLVLGRSGGLASYPSFLDHLTEGTEALLAATRDVIIGTIPNTQEAPRQAYLMEVHYSDRDWQATYVRDPALHDELAAITRTWDGGYVAAGGTSAAWSDLTPGDAWVLKLDSEGMVSEDCEAVEIDNENELLTDSTNPLSIDTTATVADTQTVAIDTTAAPAAGTAHALGNGCRILFPDLIDLAKTGQTVTDLPGDDGDLQLGATWPEPRFVDNGDGTVSDALTGLMWLKDANCAGTIGWDPNSTGDGRMDWVRSLEFVAGINDETHDIGACAGYTGEYDDWRSPNIIELTSIINWGEDPVNDWLLGQGLVNVQLQRYWTSAAYQPYTVYSWFVHFQTGQYGNLPRTSGAHVWPVRAGQSARPDPAYPANLWRTGMVADDLTVPGDDGELQAGVTWPVPRFYDQADGTVVDGLTGFMWLKDATCLEGPFDWWQAISAVQALNEGTSSYICGEYTAGHDDWRMPNMLELMSMVDWSTYSPAFPADLFVFNAGGYFWTSTGQTFNPLLKAWSLNSANGMSWPLPKEYTIAPGPFRVWPVRTSLDTDDDGLLNYRDPDDDNDGLLDDEDNCSLVENPGQEDNEGDGLGDVCDPDDDNDGLPDVEEYLVGTDPNNSDTDSDGLPDGYEVQYASILDPLIDTDAVLDQDNDGLSSLEEYLAGTQPDNPDSDADGRIDGLDSDPLVPAPNLCGGDNVVLINDVYAYGAIFDCRAQLSIRTEGTVTVESGAEVLYMAPILRLDTGFSVEAGGVFHAVGATTVAP